TTLKKEPENDSNQATLETPSPIPSSLSVPPPPSPTSTHPTISVESRPPSPRADGSEEQIAAISKELESKEVAQAVLMQQLADMERQYRQQEDSLKSEILKLREQQ